jgi:hypothetical protein
MITTFVKSATAAVLVRLMTMWKRKGTQKDMTQGNPEGGVDLRSIKVS